MYAAGRPINPPGTGGGLLRKVWSLALYYISMSCHDTLPDRNLVGLWLRLATTSMMSHASSGDNPEGFIEGRGAIDFP